MKNTKILLFLMLLGVVFTAGKCKKKGDDNQTPVGVKGSWRITSIANTSGVTPANLSGLVNGTAVFGDTNYEFKASTGTTAESGNYVYDATANTLNATPSGTSVFTNAAASYTFLTTLTSTTLQLKVNVAPAGKPANEITVSLTKQQ
jgi:hypothetical protein